MKAHQKHYMSCHLAGRQYHDADLVWDYLRVGSVVRLEREADNTYDPNAVQVIFNKDGEDYLLGYIPKGENKEVADFLEMGWESLFRCVINSINPDTHPEQQIHLTISIQRKPTE
ncbi:MAG: HIRAN domain-containing protein [Bacteroidales bacterium]|nr:HIRAN domain-containing protein [Bacteroidales bacterium]